MQQTMIYWQSIVPQHVSGLFKPIIRRAGCVSLPMVFCPGCSCCGCSHTTEPTTQCTHLATRLSGTTTATNRTERQRQWHAVYSPDDGLKEARNRL